jgi:eukaryotic-like serine/threonine-protein kinase
MELKPDMILRDRYRIIEKLGQGGMGAVYLAWDNTLETRVALKSNFNPAPDSVDQFLREAQLLAALHHQNLPRVTDYFVIGKEQYLVMDYIPGDDLGKRLKEEGTQRVSDVLNWADQLCQALQFMHRQDPPVIHRDIKPANIKLSSEGEAILVDFGIAKSSGVQAQTATGAAGYTPGYAPPEQYGQGRTGPYSDQFSLAATIYALLTRTKPADSIQRVLGKTNLLPIRDLNPAVPENVADAILKALSLQPSDRFESIADFEAALKDPDFRLEDQQRYRITSTVTRKVSTPTQAASQTLQPTLPDLVAGKRKAGFIALGVIGSLVLLGLLVVVLMVFVIPGTPLSLTAGPTSTPTVERHTRIPPTLPPTPTLTLTVPQTVDASPTTQPTATETRAPSLTPTVEVLGQTGVIAFVSDRGDGETQQIWTMRVYRDPQGDFQTDDYQQLTFNDGDKDNPVWSPDGSKIVYAAPGFEGNGLDIWVMNADGSDQVNITNFPGDEFDPAWAPDGSVIAFTHHFRNAGTTPVYAVVWIKPDGTERKKISSDLIEWSPEFSPDMKWLLFIISAQSHIYFNYRGAYNDFTTPEPFDQQCNEAAGCAAGQEAFGRFGVVEDPAWASSGNQFAYTRQDSTTRSNIVLVTYKNVLKNGVIGPTLYVLTDTNQESDPAWSADSRWIAFTSSRDNGDFEIYLMNTTGRIQVNLTQREGIDKSPSWKPAP